MDLDFAKICRVCLGQGVMMSIFKVNVSKKMMACSSVQVWQNDGLPSQICNKCCAKLHISFQFKKQCEKSDATLRQYQSLSITQLAQETIERQHPQHQLPPQQQIELGQPQQQGPNGCVYIECAPLLEIQDQKFDPVFVPPPQQAGQQPPLSQINYNIQPPQLGPNFNAGMGPQVLYNASGGMYAMSTMQGPNLIPGCLPQHMHPHLQPVMQQPEITQQSLMEVGASGGEGDNDKKAKDGKKVRNGVVKTNSDINSKQCVTCNKVFNTSQKLSRHVKTHSLDMPYKCKICNKPFSHSGNYKIHLRMHTDERPFRCTVCDKGCRQAQDLEKHMRTHTGEKPHKCHLCTRAFSTSSNLIAHVRTHTGEKPYVCCVCQKAFCQSNELTKHMRTHTGEKSHICDICNKGFNGSSTLIVHRRCHTGERPYVCTVCSKAFAQSSCLAVHMRRHGEEKRMVCTTCAKSFATVTALREHLSMDKYNCNICNKKFCKANDLTRHKKTHSFPDDNEGIEEEDET